MGPETEIIYVTNRTGSAVAIGDVEMLDTIRSDAASTTNQIGVSTGGLGNIVVPIYDVATHPHTLSCGIYGVVLDAVGDDVKCRLALRGKLDTVRCDTTVSTGNNVALLTDVGIAGDGAEAAVIVSVQYDLDGADGLGVIARKIIFLPLTARTGAGTTDGFFDGMNGFGCMLSAVDIT